MLPQFCFPCGPVGGQPGHSVLGVSILVEEAEAATGLHSVHVLKFRGSARSFGLF